MTTYGRTKENAKKRRGVNLSPSAAKGEVLTEIAGVKMQRRERAMNLNNGYSLLGAFDQTSDTGYMY